MTDQERRLAAALRDLCGWHVGMVTADGNTVFRVRGRLISLAEDDCGNWLCSFDLPGFQHLPDLDSPANWGHWAVFFQGTGTLPDIPLNRDFPRRALGAYASYCEQFWEHEQGVRHD